MPDKKTWSAIILKNMESIGQLYSLLSARQRISILLILAGGLFAAILEIITVAMMLPFVNALLGVAPEQSTSFSWLNILLPSVYEDNYIFKLSMILCGVFIVKCVFSISLLWYRSDVLFQIRSKISTRIFRSILKVQYKWHLEHNSTEIQKVISVDVQAFLIFITNMIVLLTELCMGFALVYFLFFLSPIATISLIVFFVFFVITFHIFIAPAIKNFGDISTQSIRQLLECIQQSTGMLKEIYVTRQSEFYISHYDNITKINAQAGKNYTVISAVPRVLVENILFAGIFCFIAFMSVQEDMKSLLGSMAIFAMATIRFVPVTNKIINAVSVISYHSPSITSIYKLCDDNNLRFSHDFISCCISENKADSKILKDGIEVKEVSFSYDGAQKALFQNISIIIEAQSSVALTGKTGAGKTTLADIILGLQKPTQGKVEVDGRDIAEYPDWWAQRVGYIPQQIFLSDDTIRKNVAFAVEEEQIDDLAVWRCLRMASLEDFVRDLPEGVDTSVGENGIRLSGGQRQRLGIARALYSNPVFLVMDEATSALDSETEQEIVSAINTLKGKITLLIIAHRHSTIANCDHIYQIEDGHIHECFLQNGIFKPVLPKNVVL